jgi:hypothetical protein
VRRALILSVLALSLLVSASAWAGVTTYAGSWSWPAGQAYSTSFSSSWFSNRFYKTQSFDTTLTFIDNVSYSWHSTVRGWAPNLESHWLSSQVKKAHCRANTGAWAWAACTAYS